MSFLDPALLVGLIVLAAGRLLVWFGVARCRTSEVRLTITQTALPLREPAMALDTTDPGGVCVAARKLPPSAHVALSVASGADRFLRRLRARGSRGANAAPEPGGTDSGDDPGRAADGTGTTSKDVQGDARTGESLERVRNDPEPDPQSDDVPGDVGATTATEATADIGGPEGAGAGVSVAQPGDVGVDTEDGTAGAQDQCAGDRRLVRELSSLVARARGVNQDVLDRQRHLQRDYDSAAASAQAAAEVMDGRRVLEEKEAAQRRFRAARISSRSASDVEEAAARWLTAINDLNVRVRDAQRTAASERRRATRLVAELEACGYRADAARIALEAAEEKAQQAREALAACEELQGARHAAASIASGGGFAGGEDTAAAIAHEAPAPTGAVQSAAPADDDIVGRTMAQPRSYLAEILHGDEGALDEVVAALAPDSVEDARRWRTELSALRDALVAAAIDAALVDPPRDHPFWSTFSAEEAREITVALASLGYRYDGRGGFADSRLPSTRDLALAIGYARMDPLRIRRWPSPSETPQLLDGARVAVGEFVLAGAPDLTLGQMVGLLGRRAPGFTTLWDKWGRVRPLLAGVAR